MWKHRLGFGAILLAALLIYVVTDEAAPLILAGILLLAALLGLFVQLMALRGLTVTCAPPGAAYAGGTLSAQFTASHAGSWPLGTVQLSVTLENILYREKKTAMVCLQPREKGETVFDFAWPATNCGAVSISADTLKCYDMLGLFCFRKKVSILQETIVYPPELHLSAHLGRRPQTTRDGELYDHYRKGQDVSEAVELRDYIPGDMQKSVHWKLSGKLDRLIVREFGYPSNYQTLVLCELMKRSGETVIPKECLDGVLAVTQALSYSLIEQNLAHNVGRVTEGAFWTEPVGTLAAHETVCREILCIPADEQTFGVDTVSQFLRGNLKNAFTKIIYITPVFDETAARQLSEEVDLTVICVAKGTGQQYASASGYAVIAVDADHYTEKMQMVEI